MLGYWILGFLAAFGALSALWAVFGVLLPDLRGCAVVCWGRPEAEVVSRYRWLKGLGLLSCPLLIVAEKDGACPDAEICSGEALLSRLEWERNRFDGTGNGDHSGNHQCGGIPEL